MALEDVWQILLWVGFVFGVPALITAMFPKKWISDYNKSRKDRIFALPFIALLIIWIVINAILVFAAHRIHSNGGLYDGWIVYPVELLAFTVMIVMVNFWFIIYFNPCKDTCVTLVSYLFVATLVTIAVFLLFFFVDTISGFLIIPLAVFMVYLLIVVTINEQRPGSPCSIAVSSLCDYEREKALRGSTTGATYHSIGAGYGSGYGKQH